MRRISYLFFVIVLGHMSSYGDALPYFSPGFTLSINLNGQVIFSPKISIGIADNGRFYNITFGRSISSDTNTYPHHFFELQVGALSEHLGYRKQTLFIGGGIGFTFLSSQITHLPSMRFSVFTGYWVFLNATVLLKDRVEVDIGPQFVLPLPLRKIGGAGG